MRFGFRVFACALGLVVAGMATLRGTSHAEEPPSTAVSRFSWSAPSECPSKADVLAQTAPNLGREVDLRGEASIHKVGARYRLRMHLRVNDAETERELLADQCASLADAAALIAALAIDPDATMRRRVVMSADAGGPNTGAGDAAAGERGLAEMNVWHIDAGPAPKVRRADGTSGFVELLGTLDTTTTPAPAPGMALKGGVALGWFRPSISLGTALAQEVRSTRTASVGASLALRSAELSLCASPFRWRPLEPALCLSSAVDWVHASAFGAADNLTEDVFWVTLGASLALRAYLTERFFLAAQGGIAMPLRLRSFVISGEGTLHTPPPATFRAALGPGVVF